MKRLSVITMGLLVVGFTVFGCSHQPSDRADAGWTALFDGSGFDNWIAVGDANWRLADGLVQADGGNGYLVTRNSYKDFQIRAEFWVDDDANSGIFIRLSDPKKITATNSYEVNIFDKRPDPSYGTGAIVNFAKVAPMPKAGGKWNTYEITAKGSQLTVVLNGAQTVNIQNGEFPQGPFALQFGNGPNDAPGGAIKWRKVQVRPL